MKLGTDPRKQGIDLWKCAGSATEAVITTITAEDAEVRMTEGRVQIEPTTGPKKNVTDTCIKTVITDINTVTITMDTGTAMIVTDIVTRIVAVIDIVTEIVIDKDVVEGRKEPIRVVGGNEKEEAA